MTKDARKKQLDGINESRIKLGELAAQLGSFIGGEGKVAETINKAKECLQERMKKCKNCENLDDSDNCQNDPNCQSIQQKIDELQKQENAIKDNKNNPGELLNNFCTGLEKFLGFDSASKGYNGTGIVYSDLDRLCDAVMGFLSGIITEVKKDTNLTIYNGNLEIILHNIKLARYNRKNFDNSIVAVSQGIDEWIQNVEISNENITRPLQDLQDIISKHVSVNTDNITITVQLQNLRGFSSLYLGEIQECEKALKAVDESLRNKISSKLHFIREVFQNFWMSVNDNDVINSVEGLRNKYINQRRNVNDEIVSKISQLQRLVNERIIVIASSVENLRKVRKSQFGNVDQSIRDALELSDNIITDVNQTYKTQLQHEFTTLKEAMRDFDPNDDDSPIVGTTSSFRRKVELILTRVSEIGDTLREKMLTIDSKIRAADETMTSALKNVTKIVNEVTGNEPPNNKQQVENAVQRLREKMQHYYVELKTKTLESLSHQVSYALENLGSAVTTLVDTVSDQASTASTSNMRHHRQNHIQNVPDHMKSLKDIAQQLLGAAQQIPGYNGRTKQQYGYALPLGSSSTQPYDELKRIHAEIEQLDQTYRTPSAQTLSNYVSAMKRVLSEIVNSWKIDATHGMSGFKALNINSDDGILQRMVNPLHQLLQNASQFAGHLYGQLQGRRSQPMSKYGMGANLNGYLDNLRDAYSTLNALMASVRSFGSNFIQDKKAIDTLEQTIKQPFDSLVDIVRRHADGPEGLKQILTTFQNNTIDTSKRHNDSIAKLHHEASNFQVTELSTTAGKIHQAIQKVLETINNDLDKLPTAVDAAQKVAQNIIECVGEDAEALRNKINTIAEDVKAAEEAFNDAISELNTSFETARDAMSLALPAVQGNLQRQVNEAFDHLEDGAQKMFAEVKKVELKCLNASLNDHISSIDGIIADDMDTGLKGLIGKLKETFNEHPLKSDNTKLNTYATMIKNFCEKLFADLLLQPDLTPLTDALSALLSTMHSQRHISAAVSTKLAELQTQLDTLTPAKFADASPLLDVVKAGVRAFHGELAKQYVSRYSGKTIEWLKPVGTDRKEELTEEALKCGKVFFSCLPMLLECLTDLKDKCGDKGDWKTKQIHIRGQKHNENPLGKFFEKCGYIISKKYDTHEGHLRNKPECTGSNIHGRLFGAIRSADTITKHLTECESNKDPKTDASRKTSEFDISDILACFYHHLDKYNEAYHLSTLYSTKKPCSVFEMLQWLSGLTHNPVSQDKLNVAILDLIEEPEKEATAEIDRDIGLPVTELSTTYLDTYPHKIPYEAIQKAVTEVCGNAYDVLCAIAGTGDELTFYASDYSNNSMKFHYPQIGEDCLDMLLDILRRVFPPLKFLLSQCGNHSTDGGWFHCTYGEEIGPAKWECKDHSKTKVECQTTSPLQSYLNDCLPGHLPHELSSIGCKTVCATCPKNKRGMPCLTPLGFKVMSASTRRGKDLCNVLSKFITSDHITALLSLVTKTPTNLPEHLSFASSLVNGWHNGTKYGKADVQTKFENAAKDMTIELYSNPADLTKTLINAYGSESVSHYECEHHHLMHLTAFDMCTRGKKDCAPYLSSLCGAHYTCLPYKHFDTYLSWAIYLPWTFWDLLNNLYNSFCSINCQDWGCRGCLRGDKCKKGEHGVVDDEKPNNKCQCSSIVDCKGVAPTLYQYGFVFGEASTLNDKASPKKCSDFCSQLKNVLTSEYFKKLFEECDNFLWKIREPFSYLILALWLLSLFYLLHIMVIRLDLLHIKSHLHSPSSHRIAAQSLLAAGRVNKLGRVFYLQP